MTPPPLPVSLLLLLSLVAPLPAAEPTTAPAPRDRLAVEAILAKAPKPKPESDLRPLHVLLVAGPKDHGPGEHDYPKWQKDWSALLAGAPKTKVSTAFPWPEPGQWDGVDLAVCYLRTKWTKEQIEDVRRLQSRGGGVVLIHWAIMPDSEYDLHQQIVGLTYKSARYRHAPFDLKLATTDHPITAGLPQSIRFTDEPYWPMIGDERRVTVLATSDEKLTKDAEPKPIPQVWAFEPAHGGRAFVSIPGHYAWSFDDPYFRLLILRGMAWAAGEMPTRWDALSLVEAAVTR